MLYCSAVVQPAFDLLGKRDSYVIDIGASRGGLVALALILMVAFPGMLALLLWGANPCARRLAAGFGLAV